MSRYFTIVILAILSLPGLAQDNLKIFIDCEHCDEQQIRQRIGGVDYVNDKFQANLHLLITDQSTGSGGKEIKVNFIPVSLPGMSSFTLISHTPADATTDSERTKTLETIQYGLMPFLFSTGQEHIAKIEMDQDIRESNHDIDPWNYWVFAIGGSANLEAEETERESGAMLELEAFHITEIWKIEAKAYSSREFKWVRDGDREITSNNITQKIQSSAVYSVTNHWSAGLSSELRSDNYRNLKSQLSLGPAIEYNFFPWKESDRRVFTVSYHLNAVRQVYLEETIYEHTNEVLARQSLRSEITFMQPWGNFEVAVEGRNYLHDLSRYGLRFESELEIRLFKGLSIFMESDIQAIHDQLYLPKEGSSMEDILIQRSKQATSFDLEGRVGLKYTFGSIYNNIVNRRL